MSYSNERTVFSKLVDLTAVADVFLLAPLADNLVIHRVGILCGTVGSSGVLTVTFQKTVGGTGGTDTTVKALVSTSQAAGTVIWGEPTSPVVIGPGDYLNLSVPAETSGTASAVSYALVEYSTLTKRPEDDTSLTETA